MIAKFKKIYLQHKEIINYVIFGALTTAVDWVTYYVLTRLIGLGDDFSNVLSQIASIIFAFITNKLYVFEDKDNSLTKIISQFIKFFSVRLVTLILNSTLFYVMTDILAINDFISKFVIAIVIIILNYVFSKLIVFSKKKSENK